MIYKWTDDAHHKAELAQPVGEKLEELANGHGRLTTEVVLKEAKKQSSVLHQFFTWDDTKAANEYRKIEARWLIASVSVVRYDVKEPVRAFVNVVAKEEQLYHTIQSAMSDEELRKALLTRALAELEGIQKRYATLTELAKVFKSIERVAKVVRKETRVKGEGGTAASAR